MLAFLKNWGPGPIHNAPKISSIPALCIPLSLKEHQKPSLTVNCRYATAQLVIAKPSVALLATAEKLINYFTNAFLSTKRPKKHKKTQKNFIFFEKFSLS